MKKLILLATIILSSAIGFAQKEELIINSDTVTVATEENENDEDVYTIVEEMPAFPGGQEAMFNYIEEKIKYPEAMKEAKLTGTVYVNFVVGKTGKIKDAKVLRGIGGGCDEEALRVVENMPNWEPGRHRGKAKNVSYNLPIRFTLNGKKKKGKDK